jgi:hypothetical protein
VIWYKPREGENCIRLIPWLSADKSFDKYVDRWGTHWGIDLIFHQGVGSDKGTYLCLDKMKGEPCPICEVWRTEDVEALTPKDRVLCWLIDRDDEKSGPKLWAMPLGNSRDISGESTVKGSGDLLAIDDPEEGYDVFFVREGTKRNTRYKQFAVDRNPSPLSENPKTQDKWLGYVTDNPLPELLKYYEPEYLDKVLSGQAAQSEEAEDEGQERGARRGRGSDRDDPPPRRGRDDGRAGTKTSRRGAEPEPEPEDDEPPPRRGTRRPEPADDAEFTRPARRPARAAAEPEEEPEPEEREDRPPSSRRDRRAPEPRDDDPPPRRSRAERDPPDPEPQDDPPPRRGGTTERYRGRAAAEEPEAGEPEVRERLSGVGRRGGRR